MLPKAMTIAPVSVATSIISFAPKDLTYVIASAKTNLPSASVLSISIVLPDIVLTISPGFCAFPPGMFSVAGTTAITFIRGCNSAIANILDITAPPPAMSPFISPILVAGLIEIPPESNVIPFPTSASLFGLFGFPLYSKTINLGSSFEPFATPSNAPIPKSFISS